MPSFGLHVDREGTRAVLRLTGELDMAATLELDPALDALLADAGVEVAVLDLRGLDFMDSSGLRLAVLAARRWGAADRRLVAVRGDEAVMRVFEITHMTGQLAWVDAPEEVRA